MKIGKNLACLGVLIFGSVILVVIDHLIGVSFKDVSRVAELTHKAIYMLWGGVFLTTMK